MPRARVTSSSLDTNYVVVHPEFAETLTTRHERRFEVTLQPDETLTRQPPNVGDRALSGLDDEGLIRVGERVEPGKVLLGRARKRGGASSPEEKLLRAIFGETSDYVNSSLHAPAWCFGEVSDVTRDGDQVVIVVSWDSPLEIGDVLELDGTTVSVSEIERIDGDVAWSGGDGELDVTKTSVARSILAARSIGPYHAFHQQPLQGRDVKGGQLVTRELATNLAEHAPWTLCELATIKADCVGARTSAYESLYKGANPDLGRREASAGLKNIFDFFEAPAADGVPGVAPESAKLVTRCLEAIGVEIDFRAPEVEARRMHPDDVDKMSHGAVTKPALEDDEPAGLHSQKIFGPVRDYECGCGKYKRMKHRGVVCEKCGVEVIGSKVRRERVAHIDLATSCTHPLFGHSITRIPVLPPDARPAGADDAYLAVLRANQDAETGTLQEAIDQLLGPDGVIIRELEQLWTYATFNKTVDYSAVAALVPTRRADPETCFVPHTILRELFRPMTYGLLEAAGVSTTVRQGRALVEDDAPEARAALEAASEGRVVLLNFGHGVVARRIMSWDAPAVGVDPVTAWSLGPVVKIFLPITHEAQLEWADYADHVEKVSFEPAGWLARSLSGGLLTTLKQAITNGEKDPVNDPLVACMLGRLPPDLNEAALDALAAQLDQERQRRIEELTPDARPSPQPPEELMRPITELDLSPQLAELLEQAGIQTVARLCGFTDAEFLKMRGTQRQMLLEVKRVLGELGLSTGMRF